MVKRDEIARKYAEGKSNVHPADFKEPPLEVCLDPRNPVAREYRNDGADERLTVNDTTPGLQSMVLTGNVASMGANILSSSKYVKGDLDGDGDDEEDHDTPDYSALSRMDRVEQDAYVDSFVSDPKNRVYEKKDVSSTDKSSDESTGGAQNGASSQDNATSK